MTKKVRSANKLITGVDTFFTKGSHLQMPVRASETLSDFPSTESDLMGASQLKIPVFDLSTNKTQHLTWFTVITNRFCLF